MNDTQTQYAELVTDVLIIGGGGAALRAALAVHEAGADVLLATKGKPGKTGATYCSVAEVGAFNVPDAAIDPTDSPDVFYKDIMDAALGMADSALARIVADEAIDAKNFLEQCGMAFARQADGSYLGYKACFSSKARSHVIENHFKPIIAALMSRLEACGIGILEDTTIVSLLVSDNVCGGAFALAEGKPVLIRAKSVVVAAGGASSLFRRNMYPADITGDGYAMAHRAGADIANMEFIQTGIGLAWPEVNLFGNQLWEAMPRLTNGLGEAFLYRHITSGDTEEAVIRAKGGHFPFSTRDISRFVEIGVQREIIEGHPTQNGNVCLDFLDVDFEAVFARPGSRLKAMWPLTYRRFKELDVDLYKEKIEIACFAHAINGGILIDAHGASSVEGLFAAGEAASGPHGADRLGGNMSVTCQIFGKRAGKAAADRSRALTAPVPVDRPLREALDAVRSLGAMSPQELDALMAELQQASDEALLIVRSEEKLTRYCSLLDSLEARLFAKESPTPRAPVPLARLVELHNLISTGRLIATAALHRKESRGSHYRSDYPDQDPAFASPYIIKK